VASFAKGRIGYREWARRSGRLDYIHSLDDRFDYDIDELMAKHLVRHLISYYRADSLPG
jgi:hypothetical protein